MTWPLPVPAAASSAEQQRGRCGSPARGPLPPALGRAHQGFWDGSSPAEPCTAAILDVMTRVRLSSPSVRSRSFFSGCPWSQTRAVSCAACGVRPGLGCVSAGSPDRPAMWGMPLPRGRSACCCLGCCRSQSPARWWGCGSAFAAFSLFLKSRLLPDSLKGARRLPPRVVRLRDTPRIRAPRLHLASPRVSVSVRSCLEAPGWLLGSQWGQVLPPDARLPQGPLGPEAGRASS